MPKIVEPNHVRIVKMQHPRSYGMFFHDDFFKDPFTFTQYDDCLEFKRAIFTDENIRKCIKHYNAYRLYITTDLDIEIGAHILETEDEDTRIINL